MPYNEYYIFYYTQKKGPEQFIFKKIIHKKSTPCRYAEHVVFVAIFTYHFDATCILTVYGIIYMLTAIAPLVENSYPDYTYRI